MTDTALIEYVQTFDVIWDKGHPKHKETLVVQNAWIAIATALNLPVDICKQRFANIRHRYCKERRLMQNFTISGADGTYTSQWPHFAACAFLDKVIIPRSRRNYKSSIIPEESDETSDSKQFVTTIDENEIPKGKRNIIVQGRKEFSGKSSTVSLGDILLDDEDQSDDLILHDVFSNHGVHCSIPPSPTTTEERSSPSPLKDTRSPPCMYSPVQPTRASHLNDDSICFHQRTSFKSKKIKTDDISDLSKCLVGTFTKLYKFLEKTSQPKTTQSELLDEDFAFGRSMALSIKQVSSNRKKMKLKARIMEYLADELDD